MTVNIFVHLLIFPGRTWEQEKQEKNKKNGREIKFPTVL
jgi:hypothetical protein